MSPAGTIKAVDSASHSSYYKRQHMAQSGPKVLNSGILLGHLGNDDF